MNAKIVFLSMLCAALLLVLVFGPKPTSAISDQHLVENSWSPTISFAAARAGHSSVVYNGYLYMIGGWNGSYLDDVQYALINQDGSIGPWNSTTSFAAARAGHSSVVYHGYLYVIGGFNNTYLNDVQYAPINQDGTLGSWNSTTSFAAARYRHSSVVYDGYLYVIGGWNGSYLDDVQYAQINADGTLGSWNSTTSFAAARAGHSSVVYNGYLYVIGGWNGSYLNDVQYAQINSNGALGLWSSTTSLMIGRSTYSLVAYNGYLYVIGGWNGSYLNNVQYAPINPDRTLGTWRSTTSFTTARSGLESIMYNDRLYVIGGYAGSYYFNDVQYASINQDGTPGPWNWTTSLPNARACHATVVYDNYLYVIGGFCENLLEDNWFNYVKYAPIYSDGTLGLWRDTTPLPTPRYELAAVVYHGYLYVIAGYENKSGAMNFFGDVLYARINQDGTIDNWRTTTSLPMTVDGHTAVVHNGYIYVLGGCPYWGGYSNGVYYAKIYENGEIGPWLVTSSFTTARADHATVVYNDYLYVIGGKGYSGLLDDIQYAQINPDGTVGPWSSTTSLTTARDGHTSIAYNDCLYVIGGYAAFSTGCFINEIQRAAINSDGTIGLGENMNDNVSGGGSAHGEWIPIIGVIVGVVVIIIVIKSAFVLKKRRSRESSSRENSFLLN